MNWYYFYWKWCYNDREGGREFFFVDNGEGVFVNCNIRSLILLFFFDFGDLCKKIKKFELVLNFYMGIIC